METGEVFWGGGQLNRSGRELGVDWLVDCWKLTEFAAAMGALLLLAIATSSLTLSMVK